jgi:hypothetical protein
MGRGVTLRHCLQLNHLSSCKKEKKEENPFKIIEKGKEDPQMNDSIFLQEQEIEEVRATCNRSRGSSFS